MVRKVLVSENSKENIYVLISLDPVDSYSATTEQSPYGNLDQTISEFAKSVSHFKRCLKLSLLRNFVSIFD